MTFDTDHLTVDNARGINDDELFTTPSTDPTPDRHPSVLRPGGHSSPLKHPSALRPGAARHSRTPSPHSTPASPPAHPPRASPSPVAYKAYSPPKPQSPSDELSSEIEGYFTALEVPPLRINRTPELSAAATPPLPPKVHDQEPLTPEQRCASPPVPPKERIPAGERQNALSPLSELEAPTGRTSQEHVVSPVSEPDTHAMEEEAPPPYEESQSIPPPPEKVAPSNRSNSGSPASAAAASAAHVGGAAAGVPVNDAIASSSAALAAVMIEEPAPTSQEQATGADHDDDIYSAGPPPLPPRPSPSPTGKGKDPAIPGAFPPPPSQPSPGYKASGAAATSAAGVGGSIAGVGQSASLKQARKALEKGLGHLIDKAKEHHHAREQQHGHERKSSGRKKSPEGGKKSVDSSGNVAQVSGAHSGLGLGVDADLYY